MRVDRPFLGSRWDKGSFQMASSLVYCGDDARRKKYTEVFRLLIGRLAYEGGGRPGARVQVRAVWGRIEAGPL